MAIENGKWVFPTYTELAPAVRRFFEILDTQEFSDNAQRYFNPIKLETDNDGKTVISSIRVYKTAELSSLLPQMKELSEYDCRTLGEYNTPKTGTCDCEEIQGNYVCKYNNI